MLAFSHKRGGLPIRTRLEEGPVEVVNLIAHRARFDINLHVVDAGTVVTGEAGRTIVYAPADKARVEINGLAHSLAADHALKVLNDRTTNIAVTSGQVLIGSIRDKR